MNIDLTLVEASGSSVLPYHEPIEPAYLRKKREMEEEAQRLKEEEERKKAEEEAAKKKAEEEAEAKKKAEEEARNAEEAQRMADEAKRKSADELYEKAQAALESHNFEACERYINEALKLIQAQEYVALKNELFGKWVDDIKKKADDFYSKSNLEEALKCLQKAVRLMPDDAALKKQRDDLKAEIEAKKKRKVRFILFGALAIVLLLKLVPMVIEKISSADETYYDDTEEVVEEEVANSEPEMVIEESSEQKLSDNFYLNLFEVKGNVKSISYSYEGEEDCWPEYYLLIDNTEVIFNEQGEWVNKPNDVSFDENGLIKEINGYFIGFNDNNNLSGFGGNAGETDFDYDENKELSSVTIVSKSSSGVDTSTCMIEVVEHDSHGNWTVRRSGKGAIERRSITYYGETDSQNSNGGVAVIVGDYPRLYLEPDIEAIYLKDEDTGRVIYPKKGERFSCLGLVKNMYYKINYNGRDVYVYKDNVEIEN